MSKCTFFTGIGIVSLITGAGIYLLFRNGMYITKPFEEISILSSVRRELCAMPLVHISYYFPDFLWAFSLCSLLIAILGDSLIAAIFCGLTTVLWGALWETLQFLAIVQGTGDIFDILMYLLAAISVLLIFIIKEKKDEKNT